MLVLLDSMLSLFYVFCVGHIIYCLVFLLTNKAHPTSIKMSLHQTYTTICLYANPNDLPLNKSYIKKKVDTKTKPSIPTCSRFVAACQSTAAESPRLRSLVISRPHIHFRQRPNRTCSEPSKLLSIASTTTRDLLRETPPEV